MVGKEQAETIAKDTALSKWPGCTVVVVATTFFEPDDFIRRHRFTLSQDGKVERDAVGPAHWSVVLMVTPVHPDPRLNEYIVYIDIDPSTGEARFIPSL